MEQYDLGDGAQTQRLAGWGSGSSFVEVVSQSLPACLVQDEEPSAAAAGATGFDDLATVTSHQAVGSVADAQPLAGGDPHVALVPLRSCTQ